MAQLAISAARRLGVRESAAHTVIDDAARGSGASLDDLARSIVSASDPSADYQQALRKLRESDVPADVVQGVLCDALGDAVQDPDSVTAASLGKSLARNLAGKLGGQTIQWADAAESIATDIADGKSSHPLWARVVILKIQHC